MNKLNIPIYKRRLYTPNNNYILHYDFFLMMVQTYIATKIRFINNTAYGIRINIIK